MNKSSFDIELTDPELRALKVIRHCVAHEGGFPSLRLIQRELGYQSPRSAAVLLEKLSEKNLIRRTSIGTWIIQPKASIEKNRAETVQVPLVGEVACGTPLLAKQNVQAYLAVSTEIAKPNNRYFFLRARGTSMNQAGINEGDLLLVRSQNTANEGDIVVALIDDEATVKKLHIGPDCIVLNPRSSDPTHTPIILTDDFRIQGQVIKVIPKPD